ncbi:hypothetical protein GE09DRAFT_1227310 [Coniochaeta sp. 2T2.1]|nr:hypothetical protein GE09DRAFT_1227310 [Coniochaeta sp. 2T2.1]
MTSITTGGQTTSSTESSVEESFLNRLIDDHEVAHGDVRRARDTAARLLHKFSNDYMSDFAAVDDAVGNWYAVSDDYLHWTKRCARQLRDLVHGADIITPGIERTYRHVAEISLVHAKGDLSLLERLPPVVVGLELKDEEYILRLRDRMRAHRMLMLDMSQRLDGCMTGRMGRTGRRGTTVRIGVMVRRRMTVRRRDTERNISEEQTHGESWGKDGLVR